MIGAATVPKKVWTEAELKSLPEDGYIHELVNGELVMSPKNNYQHGDICAQLLIALGLYAREHKLGAVWDSTTGFWMHNRNCRAPDVSFVCRARLKGLKRSDTRFFPGAPDLAVELLAPSNTPSEISERLKDFSAAELAWPGSFTQKRSSWKFITPQPDVTFSTLTDTLTGKICCPVFAIRSPTSSKNGIGDDGLGPFLSSLAWFPSVTD